MALLKFSPLVRGFRGVFGNKLSNKPQRFGPGKKRAFKKSLDLIPDCELELNKSILKGWGHDVSWRFK